MPTNLRSRAHFFRLVNPVSIPQEKKDRIPPGHNLWHCSLCDTEVAMPKGVSQNDVNRIYTYESRLACLPPNEFN